MNEDVGKGTNKDMDLKSMDKLEQSKALVNGLRDTMYYLETAKQDKVILITILSTFEAVLEKIYLILEEIEKKEKVKNDDRK
ncbi:MAG: hypothetical protein J1E98_13515 [Lachnospiraceae bacterium]|nr:hypothetical protein [Lachnospiraceae bacterium]